MRRYSLLLLTLVAVCVSAPVKAQLVTAPATAPALEATPDAVVARLMTFDRNHDGLVARAELPERMLGLLKRADVSKDDALDSIEVRKLASAPAPQVAVRGLQAGQYGFGEDNGFDTRLHIDGAIEDLRLASAVRDEALAIGRKFAEASDQQAKDDLTATMEKLLNREQLSQVKGLLSRQAVRTVQFSQHGEVFVSPAVEGAAVPKNLIATKIFFGPDIARTVQGFDLPPDQKREALAAIEQFKSHKTLSDSERSALLQQLKGLLDDQQRDDLRAALERRPIVKQQTHVAAFRVPTQILPQTALPHNTEPGTTFAIRDLVLRQ